MHRSIFMHRSLVVLAFTALMGTSQQALAATDFVDVPKKLSTRLAKFGPVPVTVTKGIRHCERTCPWSFSTPYAFPSTDPDELLASCYNNCWTQTYKDTERRLLTFGDVDLKLLSDVTIGTPEYHTLPDELHSNASSAQNCDTQAGKPPARR